MPATVAETRPLCQMRPWQKGKLKQQVTSLSCTPERGVIRITCQGNSDQLKQMAQPSCHPFPLTLGLPKTSAIQFLGLIWLCYCTKHIIWRLYRCGELEYAWGLQIKCINESGHGACQQSICRESRMQAKWEDWEEEFRVKQFCSPFFHRL